jgi:prepilin-type N-terminal cleavage/methylation domain-containing protein
MKAGLLHRPVSSDERGFTLMELLITMAITTVILGATLTAMTNAMRATEAASLMSGVNNGLRTAMDLMVRDMLQVGQGLPSGRVILLPSGAGSSPIQIPGPPGTDFQLDGPSFCPPDPPDDMNNVCERISAVIPGPGRGPEVFDGQPTDMITTLATDSAFDRIRLSALAADGSSMTVLTADANFANPGPHIIRTGDLIMLVKGSSSAFAQVTNVSGQQVFFASGDSLNLNQTAAADGTVAELRAAPPAYTGPVTTIASRVRMVSYYLDVQTEPGRPRLVRRLNNGHPTEFDNSLGTAVAFDIEGLQITYDLVDGINNPANVRMNDDDLNGAGACTPEPCSPNQIRKINIMLMGRSRAQLKSTRQYYRTRLITQVSLRSLALVDRYR